MVQQSESPLLHLDLLLGMRREMRAAGFDDITTLQFPLPTYPTGWWSATVAGDTPPLAAFREKDVLQGGLQTRYYTAEVHRAAFAMPAFFLEAIAGES